MNSDDKKGKLKTANVRLMTHPDFQSLLETHVMGDVFLVDDQNKIGVINDNFGPGRQEHTHRFGLKEVIKYCSERAAIDSSWSKSVDNTWHKLKMILRHPKSLMNLSQPVLSLP